MTAEGFFCGVRPEFQLTSRQNCVIYNSDILNKGILEMGRPTKDRSNQRLIHIWVPTDLHKQMRFRVAALDTTIQDWVVQTLRASIKLPRESGGKR